MKEETERQRMEAKKMLEDLVREDEARLEDKDNHKARRPSRSYLEYIIYTYIYENRQEDNHKMHPIEV